MSSLRGVEPVHLCAAIGGSAQEDAGTAADVQHALAG
jgi:hypothetical protein